MAPLLTLAAGMPQFDFKTFPPQLIWLAITFVALYLLMSRIALPRIGDVIQERRDRIERDLDTADRLKTETEQAIAVYEQALAEARGKAGVIAKETREGLAAEVDKERERIDEQLNAKLAEAETRIAAAKVSALTHVNDIAAETAGSIVKALIDVDVDADEVKTALDAQQTG
jgi:F-type H+-transporting ATPase subunit b